MLIKKSVLPQHMFYILSRNKSLEVNTYHSYPGATTYKTPKVVYVKLKKGKQHKITEKRAFRKLFFWEDVHEA